jgi:hypothetical protein
MNFELIVIEYTEETNNLCNIEKNMVYLRPRCGSRGRQFLIACATKKAFHGPKIDQSEEAENTW